MIWSMLGDSMFETKTHYFTEREQQIRTGQFITGNSKSELDSSLQGLNVKNWNLLGTHYSRFQP